MSRAKSSKESWIKRLKLVVLESLISWAEHRASSKGAALAFYTLFSMTPILVLAIAFAGYFSVIKLPRVRSLDKYKD